MNWFRGLGSRFYQNDDGAGGSPPTADPLASTFGGLDTSAMPELAWQEEALETEPATEEPEQTTEEPDERPEEATEPEGEADAEAPEDGTTDAEEDAAGDQEAASDEHPDVLAKLIAKYQGKPTEAILSDLLNIQRLASRKGNEAKGAQDRLDKVRAFIEEVAEETADGFQLKTAAAAKHLQAQRGQSAPDLPSQQFTLKDFLDQAAQELRESFAETVPEDAVDDLLQSERMVEHIKRTATERFQGWQNQIQAVQARQVADVGMALQSHIQSHPEHNDDNLMAAVNEFYERIPPHLRHSAVAGDAQNEAWMPFPVVFEFLSLKRGMEPALIEAFEAGRKHQREHVEPRDGGVPASGRRAPGKAGGREDPDAEMKRKMLAPDMPGIESLFSE